MQRSNARCAPVSPQVAAGRASLIAFVHGMSAFKHKLAFNRRSLLRMLLGVYLFLLSVVCFSLSVPPADLPLCGLMFALAVAGVFL